MKRGFFYWSKNLKIKFRENKDGSWKVNTPSKSPKTMKYTSGIDPIKDQVAWDMGYINWSGFKKALKEGNETAWIELDIISSKVAREYGKDIEANYESTHECYHCGW